MTNVININTEVAQPVFPIVKNDAGEFVHQIPEACHPGFIRGAGEATERVKSALNFVAKELTNLNLGRVKLDPNHNNEVKRGFDEIGRAITESRSALKAEEKRLTDALIEKSGFKADPALTAIVVGTFQGMAPNDRVNALNKLIEQNDGGTLAILDSVSNVYTGLSDDLKATIRTRSFAKADPETFARLEDTRFNLSQIEAASIASANACSKFSAPMHRAAAMPKEVHKSVVG